jgi:DNA-binding PadR family transcriptional regulator
METEMFHYRMHRHDCDRRYAHGGYEGRGFGHRRHGWRRGHGGRRMFEQGDLRYVLLHLLVEKPRHGYEIIKAIEDHFGGMYSPSPGVIYPTLTLLEELGYAAVASAEAGKKLYTVTEAGKGFLAANQAAADAAIERLHEAGRAYGDGPSPEMRRAHYNLGIAIAGRLRRGPLTQEQRLRFAQILDAAAADIERI